MDVPMRGDVRQAEVPIYNGPMPLPKRHFFSKEKRRPCIVVSGGEANAALETVTVIPITTYRDKDRFWSIPIRKTDLRTLGGAPGLDNDSIICPTEPWTFSLKANVVQDLLGTLPDMALEALGYFLSLLFRGSSRAYPCDFHPGDVLTLNNGAKDRDLLVVSAPIANLRHPGKLMTTVPLIETTHSSLRPCEVRVPINLISDHPNTIQAVADCRQLYQISQEEFTEFNIRPKGVVAQKRYIKAAQKAVRQYLDIEGVEDEQ